MKIRLLQIKETAGHVVTSAQSVANMMSEEALADRECLWCLHLNAKGALIEKELVSMGVVNTSLVHPREVFKKAILNSASSIILVHNHPSGDPVPSSDDRAVTKKLVEAGEILDIKLQDHIILGYHGAFVSLAELGGI